MTPVTNPLTTNDIGRAPLDALRCKYYPTKKLKLSTVFVKSEIALNS